MKLKIQTLTGETFEVEVEESGTIKDVKVHGLRSVSNLTLNIRSPAIPS